jgi:superfamily II DNA or RNA helicase
VQANDTTMPDRMQGEGDRLRAREEWKPAINTSEDDVQAFYNDALSRAKSYKRGVGYFTSSWIESATRGLESLAANGGTAKWITSVELTDEDWDAIERGKQARVDQRVKDRLKERITRTGSELPDDKRNALAWLIADGVVELKVGVPDNKLSGMFHDKFGIMRDSEGDRISFQGSPNDSGHAFENFESYAINCDWESDREEERVELQERKFDRIWNDEDENLNTLDDVGEIERHIESFRTSDERPYDLPESAGGDGVSGPTPRDYQREAIDGWVANGHRGLFRMATGTGKTFTALFALRERLAEIDGPTLTVVAVPVTHLAIQWRDEIVENFVEPFDEFSREEVFLLFSSENTNWKNDLQQLCSDFLLGNRENAIVITTHAALAMQFTREQLDGVDAHQILVGDEVHRLGAPKLGKGLREGFDDRIGLSATPTRHYDEEGTQHLLEYFDGTCYEYGLEQAIPEHLTRYEYKPIVVEMTGEELRDYREMTQRIVGSMHSDDGDGDATNILQGKRARITKSAERKLDRLREVIDGMDHPEHLLVFTNWEQIDDVQEILTRKGLTHQRITQEKDDPEERQEIIEEFGKNTFDALAAIKVLDEGMDVKPARRAVLMSNDRNPMQFVQRRGRVLRKHRSKEKAVIYDFLVVPTRNPDDDLLKSERNILRKELDRFDRFVEHAENRVEAKREISDLRRAYGL